MEHYCCRAKTLNTFADVLTILILERFHLGADVSPASEFRVLFQLECSMSSTEVTTPQIKSPGVILDSTLQFQAYISTITRSAYLHRRIINHLHLCLNPHTIYPLLCYLPYWLLQFSSFWYSSKIPSLFSTHQPVSSPEPPPNTTSPLFFTNFTGYRSNFALSSKVFCTQLKRFTILPLFLSSFRLPSLTASSLRLQLIILCTSTAN